MFPGSPDAHANCKVLAEAWSKGVGVVYHEPILQPRLHPQVFAINGTSQNLALGEVTQTSISLGQGGQVDIHGGIELTGGWPLSAVKGTSYIRKVRCSTLPINEKEGMLQRGSPGNKQKERNSNEKHVCLRCES